ncbi:branched-chain amino acid ABC transporter permease [Limnohabitans sp. MMS-10A-160]|uniref:branched-chain amino acid ABC transporter permease n=1 Tax=unclassified Limnohabitans TaxID=2626134 RepID=UPI000D3C358E|nr:MULTISPECIES: branched-chain amino acid ABC transporter permease [unclassified Limnohabitans]PUE19254.1 branched-chain amino acid ABC transporter permease [Limnohabitans sp. MMS-10A-192]PUE24552.1 branched-chain amino acid ABC transporter permease [Limnohabitans sp. MMS-10A-160]
MSLKKSSLGALAALAMGAVVAFGVSSSTLLSLLTQSIIYAVFALGVGVLLKQNGMVSFGHALFFGGASYLIGILLQLQLMSAELAIVVTLLAVTAAAFLIGLVIVRVPGVAFGMLTLAIGQMFFLSASRARGLTGGADGMNIDWPSRLFGFPMSQMLKPATMFLVCWSTLVVVMFLLAWLMRTRFGGITEAVRDNEERARFIGITTLLPRAAVYALSALVTSVAGVLSAMNTGFVSPESMHWSLSGVALMMVVVGGFKALWGPAVGAVVYFMFKDILGEHATHWMTIFGMALIAVIVFSPTGVAGLFDRWVLGKKPSIKVGGH